MTTNYQLRYAAHPADAKSYDTSRLRSDFLIDNLFVENEVNMVYSMYDRMVVGGAMPAGEELPLEAIDPLKAPFFTSRREVGIFNVGGGEAVVKVGEETFTLGFKEALYIGSGYDYQITVGSRTLIAQANLVIPVEIPVAGICEVTTNGRPHHSDILCSLALVNLVGKVGRVVAAKSHTHEVVETVALEGELQCLLLHYEVLDLLYLVVEAHGRVCLQSVVGHLVILVHVGTAAATGVYSHGVLVGIVIREQYILEVGEVKLPYPRLRLRIVG